MVSIFLLIAALVILAVAKPHARRMSVRESRTNIPSGFVQSGAADLDTPLKLRIALVQNDPSGLVNALYDVSTPSSPSYGEHLSKAEVEQFVAPAPESVEAVNAWLKDAGLDADIISPAGDWLSVTISVGVANELFDADFAVFTSSESGKQTIRTMSYSIPAELEGHLDFVHPTVIFPSPYSSLPSVSAPSSYHEISVPASCDPGAVNPTCVQSLYGIPTTLATQSSNQIGVSGFINEFANQADLTTFLKVFRPDLPVNTTFAFQSVDGGRNPQNRSEAGDEANFDVQYTVGIASGVPTTFISVGRDDVEGYLDIIHVLLSESNPPQVLTTSYAFNETQLAPCMAEYLCNAYAQLGARGTSILFSSGDGGVAGTQRTNSCSTFQPTFPSGCPFLTSVGATTFSSSGTETAADFSSGGFSNYFDTPSYQSSAVQSYLSSIGSTNEGKFNTYGRAFPDVSAIGTNVEFVLDDQPFLFTGTSCSSPIFASVVALINDELIAAGKSPLGFLNPFLYANPGAFYDVTSGSNPGCNTNGFEAGPGWDPVTGLGTPNFAALRAAAGL